MTIMRKSNGLVPAFNSIFNEFLNDDWHNYPRVFDNRLSVPAVNISENDDEFRIELAAPGMKKDDFKVELDKGILTISHEREDMNEKGNERDNFSCREFNYSSFKRSFGVPEEKINTDKIKASYESGILVLTLPKREEVKPKPARTIKIG